MRYFSISSVVLATSALLSACSAPQEVEKDYMLACQYETRAKGTYQRMADQIGANGLAKIVPGQGGDVRGALFMNACVERRHIRAGTLPGKPEYYDRNGG